MAFPFSNFTKKKAVAHTMYNRKVYCSTAHQTNKVCKKKLENKLCIQQKETFALHHTTDVKKEQSWDLIVWSTQQHHHRTKCTCDDDDDDNADDYDECRFLSPILIIWLNPFFLCAYYVYHIFSPKKYAPFLHAYEIQ